MLRVAFCLAFVTACVQSAQVECASGLVCPEKYTCDDADQLCIPPGCGDGAVSGREQCDGPQFAQDEDCGSYGYYFGELTCSPICTVSTNQCRARCGDHEINGPELCDGIPPIGLSCTDYGFDIGRLSCSIACGPGFGPCSAFGWQTMPGGAAPPLEGVWAHDAGDLYAVGSTGTLLHSDGQTWLPMISPTTANLHGLAGAPNGDAFAVGDGGTVLHLAGGTWTTMTSPTTKILYAVGGDPSAPLAVGEDGTVIAYSGGAWSTVTNAVIPTDKNLRAIAYDGTQTIVVGEAGTILRYAGGTWTAMTVPDTTVNLRGVWGTQNRFVAVGISPNGGVIWKFDGVNWTAPFAPVTTSGITLWAVWGASLADVFVGGEAGTMFHYDATTNELVRHSFPSRTVYAIDGLSAGRVYAVTRPGTIELYNGTLVTTESPTIQGLNAVWDTGNTRVVVGDNGTLLCNAGGAWTTSSSGLTRSLTGVYATGSKVFIANPAFDGTHPVGIYTSSLTGCSASAPVLAVNQPLYSVSGTSGVDVFAVGTKRAGDTSNIVHYNGVAWAPQTTPTLSDPSNPTLRAVWAASPSDVYAVGERGWIVHFNGSVWSAQQSNVTSNLVAVWSTGADAFAVGEFGTIVHNDGTGWRKMTWPTGEFLTFVFGSSASDVFAGGLGVMMHYDGVSWSRMTAAEFVSARGAIVRRSGAKEELVVVGDNGGVEKLDRVLTTTEDRCIDAWDDDGDGLVNCADPDCPAELCSHGGSCAPAVRIACPPAGSAFTYAATTFTGVAQLDDLPCLSRATPGPEATFALSPLANRMVTVTVTGASADLDLAVAGAYSTGGCDVTKCTAGTAQSDGSRTLTFPANGGSHYYVLVDGPYDVASDFTLTVTCE